MLVYLGGSVTTSSGVSDEINLRIMKAKPTYTESGHLWSCRDVSLAVNDRVYDALEKAVLLYACKIWSLRAENVPHLFVFGYLCLRRIADIWWKHHVSNAKVRQLVFEHSDDNSIGVTILKYQHRGLGHTSWMSSQWLQYHAVCRRWDWLEKAQKWLVYVMVSSNQRKLYRTGIFRYTLTSWLGS